MADSTYRYQPRNYRRVCDICGNLRNVSEMHKQDELWVCTYDAGERVRTQLDRGNAQQRPFTIKPVPYPKPQNNYYPNTLEADDAAVFNFLARMVEAQCRYEQVESGSAPMVSQGGGIAAVSWAARYFYDLIQENSRRLLIAQAKELLADCADYLMTRQYGTPTGVDPSATISTSAYFGGFLDSGASNLVSDDNAAAGLAILYAYRVHGTGAYLASARASATYLRNVQAMGSCGTTFPSSDATGTARLYTGSLTQLVWSFGFSGDNLFYPSALISLEFWNELKTTDGDQMIGATAACTGFDITPSQLLSTCIADLRDCWSSGITDATGTLINGLSSTTPREFFNAYPTVKTGFAGTGTGLWEFFDGDGDTGTEVTSQTFARALSALYNYEGASSQVTTLSDWLRSFTSNPDFETPDDISTTELYEGTTGTYDPTLTISTLLQVRDPDTLATTAINGSSLYDWGAFGLLSRIWASRNRGSFMVSRLYPLNTVQRFFAGNTTDTETDRIILRGQSGLTLQTGFRVTIGTGIGADGQTQPVPPSTTAMPASTVFYVDGTRLTKSGSNVTAWPDQSTLGQHLDASNAGKEPTTGSDSLDGIPGVSFPLAETIPPVDPSLVKFLGRSANLLARDGKPFGQTAATDHAERTVIAVIRPKTYADTDTRITGGTVVQFRQQAISKTTFCCMFFFQGWFNAFEPLYEVYSTDGPYGVFHIRGPNTDGSVYRDLPVIAIWRSRYPSLDVSANGATVTLSPTEIAAGEADGGVNTGANGFVIGMQDLGTIPPNFQGTIFSVLVSDEYLDGPTLGDAVRFVSSRFPSMSQYVATAAMVNDAVLAAQFGRSFREARN